MIIALTIPCSAETIRVQVETAADIAEADTNLARSAAFSAIPVKAIEIGLAHFLSEQAIDSKWPLIEKSILAKSGSFVKSIEVTAEGTDALAVGEYRLTATVLLQRERLEDGLVAAGILTYEKDLPRILAFVQEKNIDNVHWHFQSRILNNAENTIWNALSVRGFKFVDQTALAKNIEPESERSIYAEDLTAITELGHKYAANIVIIGKSISRAGSDIARKNPTTTIQAVVTLKAIDVGKGEIVAQASSEAEGRDSNMMTAGKIAIEEAARTAAAQMVEAIIRSQAKPAETVYNITMFISGIKSIEDLVDFKNELSERVTGIKTIQRRTFSGGTAAYDLQSTAPVAAIIQTLQAKGLKSFQVQIRSQSENSLELNLTSMP